MAAPVPVTVPRTIPIPIPVPVLVPVLVPVAITAWLALVVFGADAQIFGQDLSHRVFPEVLAPGFPAVAVALVHCGLASQLPDGSVTFDHAG